MLSLWSHCQDHSDTQHNCKIVAARMRWLWLSFAVAVLHTTCVKIRGNINSTGRPVYVKHTTGLLLVSLAIEKFEFPGKHAAQVL